MIWLITINNNEVVLILWEYCLFLFWGLQVSVMSGMKFY